MNWHFFGDLDFPQDGQEIILRWNDNHETRVTWQWGAYQNWLPIYPVSWRLITEKDSKDE